MTEQIVTSAMRDPPTSRRPLRPGRYLPLALFVLISIVLGIGLTMDPRKLPSPLIGKPVPQFDLPAVKGRTLGLAHGDLVGEPSLVNVFASWCTACRQEHPLWMRFRESGLAPIHGLNYKDKPDDARRWLQELGDPYTRTGADIDGRVGIDWGVYGVPETFVVDRNGVIVYKHIGPITEQSLNEKILPLLRELKQVATPAVAGAASQR